MVRAFALPFVVAAIIAAGFADVQAIAPLAGSAHAPKSVSQKRSAVPLVDKHFDYDNLPHKVDTEVGERGPQSGYNDCGPSTAGPGSLCQTAVVDSLADFCLWGAPVANSTVGDTEGEAVAWCTQNTHGARVIPAGAITGVQFIRTPDYVQVTGVINQTLINYNSDDTGGELDAWGADFRGNPEGGIVFTNAFASLQGRSGKHVQSPMWHSFMGSNKFCIKLCDPDRPNAAKYCEHIYDRLGCPYNAPASYADGVFETCEGTSQDFPGVYYDSNGKPQQYQQPPESAGEITTMPYEPRIPATSRCVQFASTAIYPQPTALAPTASTTPAPTAAPEHQERLHVANRSKSGATSTAISASGAVGLVLLTGTLALISML